MTTKITLNQEEQNLLDSFERGEWNSVKDLEKQKKIATEAAKRFLRKDVRINIRISSHDLQNIKEKAAFEGMPYQTLVASILHKFARGYFAS